MRKPNVFGHTRALPRMSWSPHNLYNLYQRTVGSKAEEGQFTRSFLTLFQQRWISKRLLRGYHGDHIGEKIFKKWYLPRSIPDVRERRIPRTDDAIVLDTHRGALRSAKLERKRRKEMDEQAQAPVGSLMWSEIERRMDVFLFRCCFAHSVYEARRLIIHGYVTLNGKQHSNANTRLAPGDLVSVDPTSIRLIKPPRTEEALPTPESEDSEAAAESETPDPRPVEVESEAPTIDGDTPPAEPSPEPSTPQLEPNKPKPYYTTLTPFNLPSFASPWLFIPAYIEVSFATCSAIYVRHPTARPGYSEIPTPYDADGELQRLAWEWYVKRRPRIRSRRRLAGGPENRQG